MLGQIKGLYTFYGPIFYIYEISFKKKQFCIRSANSEICPKASVRRNVPQGRQNKMAMALKTSFEMFSQVNPWHKSES